MSRERPEHPVGWTDLKTSLRWPREQRTADSASRAGTNASSRSSCCCDRGFSLLEVMTATALMAVGLVAVAQLFLVAIDAARWSGTTTVAATLAGEKLEQLRSLAFFLDETGTPITDSTTDLTVTPSSATGGTGLLASPASSLTANTPGYVDHLDAAGQWVGAGAIAPRNAVFSRRWSVTPVAAHPGDALLLQVWVFRASAASWGASARTGSAVLASVKARKVR
jgi:prepilin-type N-terminal cleavage/methylation domain-containing protein